MNIELLKQNIAREHQIAKDIISHYNTEGSLEDKHPLLEQMRILNNALPDLINNIFFYKSLKKKSEQPSDNLLSISYKDPATNKNMNLAVKKHEHSKFLEHLSAQKSLLAGKRGASNIGSPEDEDSRASHQLGPYISISNKLFRKLSEKMVAKGIFDSVKLDLRKITSPFIIESYVSMMLFTTFISFIFALIVAIGLFFAKVSIITLVLIVVLFPLLVFFLYYRYPATQRKSLEKNINQELPFVTIYLSAIATSGIEPSKIFGILVTSKDYPFIQREIKKLTNYINFYGYDLSSALKLTSRNCPSERLGQLFDGFASTISSGGELREFLSKHSETLLFDYKLEREKYTRLAETFMNIYISVVIAAPMLMMMIFILISRTGFATGFLNPSNLGLLTVLIISLLNIGFLVLLNMKQPKF